MCETDSVELVIMDFKVTDKDKGIDGVVDVEIISGNWNDTFFIRSGL